jgi:translation initiation factor IF-1
MVKNTHGGSKHKSQARKNQAFNPSSITITPSGPNEKSAKVTKMFGNGMCQVETEERDVLTCHIRGKFRGKNKKHNTVGVNSIVVIGLREWESVKKNCDLIGITASGNASGAESHVENEDDGFVFNNEESQIVQQTIPEIPDVNDLDLDFDVDDI